MSANDDRSETSRMARGRPSRSRGRERRRGSSGDRTNGHRSRTGSSEGRKDQRSVHQEEDRRLRGFSSTGVSDSSEQQVRQLDEVTAKSMERGTRKLTSRTVKDAVEKARFQQKQMQEKEEKLLKLYENQQQRAFERVGRGSAGSNTSSTSIGSTGGGKVRQMFDERRQKAGIDKSYPLEPIKTKSSAKVSGNTTSRTSTTIKATVRKTVSQVRNGKPSVQTESFQRVYNNNSNTGNYEESLRTVESYDIENDAENNLIEMMKDHNMNDDLDIESLPKIGFDDDKSQFMTGKLSNVGGRLPSQKVDAKPSSNGLGERNTFKKFEAKPTPTTRKSPSNPASTPPRSTSSVSSISNHSSSRNSPARTASNTMSGVKPTSSSQRAPANNRPSSKQTPKSPVVRDDLAECRYCGRRFATDRLGVHEDICGKTGKKKRKAYDATKHRVQGTELEPYIVKGGKKGGSSKKKRMPEVATARRFITTEASAKQPSAKAGNWRKTHEEFITAIRAAKQAQAYVAKGGKLSDLPPPPPSTNPDYVQCPHCGRRFNEAAAERHIPKCASYDFNKPKGGAPAKGRPTKR